MPFGGLHNLDFVPRRSSSNSWGRTGNDATVTGAAAASTVVTGKLGRRRRWETQIARSAMELGQR
jgi:hypothetical protein